MFGSCFQLQHSPTLERRGGLVPGRASAHGLPRSLQKKQARKEVGRPAEAALRPLPGPAPANRPGEKAEK